MSALHPDRQNMPILYRNIMDGLPSDFARDVFLWATERPGEDRMCYRAERLAREAGTLIRCLRGILDAQSWATFQRGGWLLDYDQRADMEQFMMTRWANWRFGGNVQFTVSTNA